MGQGPAVVQAVPAVTPAFLQRRERILYRSKITTIPKFGMHRGCVGGDVAKPCGTATRCDTSLPPCACPCALASLLHQPPGQRELHGTPRAPRGKAGGPGLASLGAGAIVPGLLSISTAPAHFHGNGWGDTDAVPCRAVVLHVRGLEGTGYARSLLGTP